MALLVMSETKKNSLQSLFQSLLRQCGISIFFCKKDLNLPLSLCGFAFLDLTWC